MNPTQFFTDGFAVVSPLLSAAECDVVTKHVAAGVSGTVGTRSMLDQDWCKSLAERIRLHPVVRSIVPSELVAVQCTYFEKSLLRNWLVPIHQDLSIPVAERVAHPDLHGWCQKEGVSFVRPPVAILEQLVAVRLHVDPCRLDDGPLKVVPRSHLRGRLTNEMVATIRDEETGVICTVGSGDVLAMRPLLLHSSSKAKGNSLRRVLHFVFGPSDLPLGLRWHRPV